MKHVQIASFLTLALCAAGQPAQAGRPLTYKAESGVQGENLESITITITQVKSAYAVSGAFTNDSGRTCKIKGSFFRATQRVKATCVYPGNSEEVTVTGIKLTGKDAFQVSIGTTRGSEMVAYRNGIKPKAATTGDAKPKDGECAMKGTWKQTTPGVGTTDWYIEPSGKAKERGLGNAEGDATVKGKDLRIDWRTGSGYSGYYQWTLDADCSSSVKGTLQFHTGRTDNLASTVKKID